MTKQVRAYCSSPAAICYWFIVSLMAWGVLSLIGIYWRPSRCRPRPRAFSLWPSAASPTGLGIALFIVPSLSHYFLIGGVMFLLSGVRMIHVDRRWVWPFVLIGVGIAFLLEWRYAQRSAS